MRSACAASIPTDPGCFFIPLGRTYPSYSSWAVTISISMAPYRKQLREIFMATQHLHHTADSLVIDLKRPTNLSNPSQVSLEMATHRFNKSVIQLERQTKDLTSMFGNMLALPSISKDIDSDLDREDRSTRRVPSNHSKSSREKRFNRRKRALFDGGGKVLSFLFGTATEGEVKHLTENVKLLNMKAVAMAHAFNGTLNVIDSTRVATLQNRKALRSLESAVQSMIESHRELNQMARDTNKFLALSLQLAELSESVNQVTRVLHHLRSSLSSLSDKLALAQAGILHPDLMSSRSFGRLLRRIRRALPTNFELPYAVDRIADYVRIAKTKLIKNSGDYHVLFYVPLLHTLHAFSIFKFFPYQVPLPNHNVSLSYVPSEPRYLVVSQNRRHYIQPRDSEMESCILDNHPFCQIHEPAYATHGAASCVVSLFREDRPAIERYCAPVIRPTNNAPRAYYLTTGKWVVVSRPPLEVTIVCPGQTSTHTLQKPVETITLGIECSASSDSMYLPPYYASESHLDLPDFPVTDLVRSSNTSIPIWRPHWISALPDPENITLMPPLHINGMLADDYFNQVTALPLEEVVDDDPASFSRSWTLILIIGIISLAFLGCVLRYCCPRSRDLWSLPRFAAAARSPRQDPAPPVAIELLEPLASRPQTAPIPAARVSFAQGAEPTAHLDLSPTRGTDPPGTPEFEPVPTVFGGRSAAASVPTATAV